MEAMRQGWTDDRLDDLRDDVNEFRAETKAGFAAVQGEFAAVRKEMRGEFAGVQDEFAAVRKEMRGEFTAVQDEFAAVRKEMGDEFKAVRAEIGDEFKAVRAETKAGFDGIHERFDRFQQTMIGFSGLVIAALIGLIATQL